MNIFKSNTFNIIRIQSLQRFVRIGLIYSLLYVTTSEIFSDNSFAVKNSKNEYLITVSQNSIELNFNERSQRNKLTDQNHFNFDKSAITSNQFDALYTEYFLNNISYSVNFFLLICNPNHSFRAPPTN